MKIETDIARETPWRKLAEETTLLSIRGKRRGDERNESCEERLSATDSTQKVLGNFVECQKTATEKNTIERTTEEETDRESLEYYQSASRTATKKEGKVQMDIDSDDGDDQHPIVRNKRTRNRRRNRRDDEAEEEEAKKKRKRS